MQHGRFATNIKWGLVPLDRVIEPYNCTLKTLGEADVRKWAVGVVEDLKKVCDLQQDQFVILAGMKYRKYLMPHMRHVQVPMEGLLIGKQLHFLAEVDPPE